jgi:hypothetical protein
MIVITGLVSLLSGQGSRVTGTSILRPAEASEWLHALSNELFDETR